MGCLSSSLIYSDTGTGKTSVAGSWAKWVYEKTGKPVRMYTAEPGGLSTIDHLVDGGLIEVWDISTRANRFETVDFAARGYWPNAADPNKLDAPTPELWKRIGGFIYEGATAFGEELLDELRVKGAANEIVGAEKAPQQFTSGTLRIASNNQTHYGIVQSRVRKAINDCQRFPVHVLWTARELKVRDEDDPKKQYVFGPLLAGSAATLNMPAWFGNTFHLSSRKEVTVDLKTKVNAIKVLRKLYTTKHFDEGSDIPYLAQVRVPAELSKELPEFFDLTDNIDNVIIMFRKIDELKQKAKELVFKK